MRYSILLGLWMLTAVFGLQLTLDKAGPSNPLLTQFHSSNHSSQHTKRQPQPYQAWSPNGPLFHTSWTTAPCRDHQRIRTALIGTLELVRHALSSLRTNGADDVFTRYFPPSSRPHVFKIFRTFLNQQPSGNAGPLNAFFASAMLGYGDPPAQWSPDNQGACERTADAAYLVNWDPEKAPQFAKIGFLAVCPRAFVRFPVGVDLPLMTTGDVDDHASLCKAVMAKGYAWEQMRGLSGLLLHEFLHWNFLVASSGVQEVLGTVINARTPVYIGDFDGARSGVRGCDPPSGYGVWNSQRLRKADGGNPMITLRNVENYVWYAHEVYFQKLCSPQAPLGPAVREKGTQPEFDASFQPPGIPGEGEPAACLLPQNWNAGFDGVDGDDDESDDGSASQ